MKIESGRPVAPSGAARAPAAAAPAPGFAPALDAPQRTTAAAGIAPVASLDVLLALQADEPPAQRRARQARRGRDALDALERLEQGLLLGLAPAALHSEIERLQGGREMTGDSGLDAVLDEIDIRLAVEAAKLDRHLGRG